MEEFEGKNLSREEKLRIKRAIKKKKRRNKKKDNTEHQRKKQKILKTIEQSELKENKNKEEVYIQNEDLYANYKEIIERFNTVKTEDLPEPQKEVKQQPDSLTNQKKEDPKNKKQPSKRQRKKQNRMNVAQLKALVARPDLVDSWDTTSIDPLLLLHLKSYKNTVPVPKNWTIKKKSLYDKKGLLKKTFKLPAFIENTGIAKLRDPLAERSSLKMIRQKLKERMNPRLGKIDIDYEILHAAFFIHQTKPFLTSFGDVHYEGKQEDQRVKAFKPGRLSPELRVALGISATAPPPWLMNIQKFGLPPAYPNMTVRGLSRDVAALVGLRVGEENIKDEEEMEEEFLWGEMREEEEETKEEETMGDLDVVEGIGGEEIEVEGFDEVMRRLERES